MKLSVGADATAQDNWTSHALTSAATTNGTSVKGSAGAIGFIYCVNLNAAVRFLKLFNKASGPTVGTDTPAVVLPIPASTAGAGFMIPIPGGVSFTTGIAYAITTGYTTADTGAVAAGEIFIWMGYA
jgi:hypothetical protein